MIYPQTSDMSKTPVCVQGVPYQQDTIKEPNFATPNWHTNNMLVKSEPMDEDRNDSGVTSGSEPQSSSPECEASQDCNWQAYFASNSLYIPRTVAYSSMHSNYQAQQIPFANNAQVPMPNIQADVKSVRTEMQTDTLENEDPLRRLEFALKSTGLIPQPSTSPKTISEHSDEKSDDEPEDEQSIRTPKLNSHGKVKTYKCKQCNYVALTKVEFWEHSKEHIKADKQLTCPKCPFVTEYKHHLEYHMRNHTGSKPYKCNKCSYSCVNKSMLNSHLKSHSNIYQYRCANCTYASKYCHSLKLHLRKYHHEPAMVLNPDGTPNPYPIVDVYGTRRGPKQKSTLKPEENAVPSSSNGNGSPSPLQNPFMQYASMLSSVPLPLQFQFFSGLQHPATAPFPFPLHLENILQPDNSAKPEERSQSLCASPPLSSPPQEEEDDVEEMPQVLDLSKPDTNAVKQKPTKSRRKGRAFKLETLPANDSSDEEDAPTPRNGFNNQVPVPKESPMERPIEINQVTVPEESPMETPNEINQVTVPEGSPIERSNEISEGEEEKVITNNNNSTSKNNNNNDDTNNRQARTCHFCDIVFGDSVIYSIHMGYHGFEIPFKCNKCGSISEDKVSFFLHVAQERHNS